MLGKHLPDAPISDVRSQLSERRLVFAKVNPDGNCFQLAYKAAGGEIKPHLADRPDAPLLASVEAQRHDAVDMLTYGEAIGLHWQSHVKKPDQGTVLVSIALAEQLQRGVRAFTRAQLLGFGVRHLRRDSCIEAAGMWFTPEGRGTVGASPVGFPIAVLLAREIGEDCISEEDARLVFDRLRNLDEWFRPDGGNAFALFVWSVAVVEGEACAVLQLTPCGCFYENPARLYSQRVGGKLAQNSWSHALGDVCPYQAYELINIKDLLLKLDAGAPRLLCSTPRAAYPFVLMLLSQVLMLHR